MLRTRNNRAPAFTLIELLTVVAIIALLIGILVPAIANARVQAKNAASRALIKGLGDGCEAFRAENNKYPDSRGLNPFESSDVYLSGAQWLTLQLAGADLAGWVKPDKRNSADGLTEPDSDDWLDWYSNEPSRQYTRSGPYSTADGKMAQTPTLYQREHPYVGQAPSILSNGGTGGSSDWNNSRLPFFVDAHGFPILYYVANPYAVGRRNNRDFKFPVSGNLSSGQVGTYDQTDNAAFTGSEGGYGYYTTEEDGWDLGAGPDPDVSPFYHPLAILGFDHSNPTEPPAPKSFMNSIFDRNLYESTDKGDGGQVKPLRPDSFLMVSPGNDGQYGTLDDIWNF